jgi:hypothetical protein
MPNGKVSASSASASAAAPSKAAAAAKAPKSENDSDAIKIIFSDLDGTLIHYPDKNNKDGNTNKNKNKNQNNSISSEQQQLLQFPPSSTGLRGIISTRTLSAVDEIRNRNEVKFVLVSGMRTSTLLRRLPYLPRADAYCSENGGRIFYPVENDGAKEEENEENDGVFWVKPKKYRHNFGAGRAGDPRRDKPFGIREDKAWRKQMEASIGGDSFGDFSLREIHDAAKQASVPLQERDGFLWDFARGLIHTHGFVLDIEGYATCFRVNQKQQTSEAASNAQPDQIRALLDAPEWEDNRRALSSSINLTCVDFYPSCSGKKNCCLYLASKFFPKDCQKHQTISEEGSNTNTSNAPKEEKDVSSSSPEEEFLSNHAVCLCDDDNDLEMALACHHAYLPSVSSESMGETIKQFPDHFSKSFRDSTDTDEPFAIVEGTDASDAALLVIYNKTAKDLDRPKKSMIASTKLGLVLCSFLLLFLV